MADPAPDAGALESRRHKNSLDLTDPLLKPVIRSAPANFITLDSEKCSTVGCAIHRGQTLTFACQRLPIEHLRDEPLILHIARTQPSDIFVDELREGFVVLLA